MHWEFPKIRTLPRLVNAEGWTWSKAELGVEHRRRFWVGTDPDGTRWVVKMRGWYNAVREHIYASLGQRLGICVQSSVYLRLPDEAPPRP